jgi:hypothetical protein
MNDNPMLAIREKSRRIAKDIGFPVPPIHLPMSEWRPAHRSSDEVVRRLCAISACIAVSFEFDNLRAIQWLRDNDLWNHLCHDEVLYLEGEHKTNRVLENAIQLRIEAMWALCWSVGLTKELDFGDYCGSELKSLVPDIARNEATTQLLRRCKLRDVAEIIAAEDLAYCLHWGVVEAQIRGLSIPIRGYVIIQRRHALSWILSTDDWDEVPLDT